MADIARMSTGFGSGMLMSPERQEAWRGIEGLYRKSLGGEI